MIKDILYILVFAGLFASCDSEQFSSAVKDDTTANNVLKLNISRADFSDMTADDSRVSNSGTSTSFTEGDVIGVLVTQDGKNYNLPYRYNGTNWEFDTSSEKKLFTKTTADENLTFILYYPYSAKADNVTTLEELKTVFPVKTDQSSEDDYISSDLLYAKVTTAESTVSAKMEHLRALFAYKPKVKFQTTVAEEGGFESYALSLADISFSDEAGEIKCYKTTDGEYRYIVDKGKTITWVYDYAGAVYEGKKELEVTSGRKYATTEFINTGVYDESKAKIGDFYCINGDNKGYVLPLEFDIASSTHTCIGIVFHVGAGSGDSQENYDGTSLASNGIRGYAVALKDAHESAGIWGPRKFVEGIESSGSYVYSYLGYKNSMLVKSLPSFGDAVIDEPMKSDTYWAFKVALGYAVASPEGTSGWYLPSIGQLVDISRIPEIETSMLSAGGYGFKTDHVANEYGAKGGYWSSSEMKDSDAWYFSFEDMNCKSWSKNQEFAAVSYVRPVLTF